MPNIIRSPLANADIIEIWNYIAEDNPAAADRLLAKFDETFRRILHQPGIGRTTDELGSGLRMFPIGSYLIFYREHGADVTVFRILHGARDITADFFTE